MSRPPANRWHLLEPPDPGDWQPNLSVSIVIPARGGQENLDRTLTALAAQTYPHDLLEVVVVDDGSEPSLEIRVDMDDVNAIVVSQEDDGRFGAGRARNRGALESSGQTLVFLDADIVTAPDVIDRYARWMNLTDDAVLTGILGFVDFTDISPDRIRAEIEAGTLTHTLDAREADSQEWREKNFARSHDLTEDRDDLFRVVIGASLGVNRELFDAVGGFRELGIRGIEDFELGYRLHVAGCLLIADRSARQWHQGRRFFDSAGAAEAKRVREPYVQQLVPVPGFRTYPARAPLQVPTLLVDVADGPQIDTARTVVSLLDTEMLDTVFHANGTDGDERFRTLESFDPVDLRAIPFRMSLEAGVVVGPKTCESVVDVLRETGAGVIHLLDHHGVELATAFRQRALTAGARCSDDSVTAAEQLFGVRWVPASDVDLSS